MLALAISALAIAGAVRVDTTPETHQGVLTDGREATTGAVLANGWASGRSDGAHVLEDGGPGVTIDVTATASWTITGPPPVVEASERRMPTYGTQQVDKWVVLEAQTDPGEQIRVTLSGRMSASDHGTARVELAIDGRLDHVVTDQDELPYTWVADAPPGEHVVKLRFVSGAWVGEQSTAPVAAELEVRATVTADAGEAPAPVTTPGHAPCTALTEALLSTPVDTHDHAHLTHVYPTPTLSMPVSERPLVLLRVDGHVEPSALVEKLRTLPGHAHYDRVPWDIVGCVREGAPDATSPDGGAYTTWVMRPRYPWLPGGVSLAFHPEDSTVLAGTDAVWMDSGSGTSFHVGEPWRLPDAVMPSTLGWLETEGPEAEALRQEAGVALRNVNESHALLDAMGHPVGPAHRAELARQQALWNAHAGSIDLPWAHGPDNLLVEFD